MNISPLMLLKPVLSVAAKYIPFLRRLVVERRAGLNPYVMPLNNSSMLLEEAMKRLGQLDSQDPMWKKIFFNVTGNIVRPEEFRKPHVVRWLSKYEVKNCLERLVLARLFGSPENEDDYRKLYETYMAESGEYEHSAKGLVHTAIIFLKSSLEGAATDVGTAGIAQAGFASVHQELKSLRTEVTAFDNKHILDDGIVMEHHSHDARTALQDVLNRRATPGATTLSDLRKLVLDIEHKGQFRGASVVVKSEIYYWLARVSAANNNIEEADCARQKALDLAIIDTVIIDAFLDVARGDLDAALKALRNQNDSDCRSTLFAILRIYRGSDAALNFFEEINDPPVDTYTAIGWKNVCGALLENNRHVDALQLIERLPSDYIDACPVIAYMKGIAHSCFLVPETYRHRLIDEQYLSVNDHLLESEGVKGHKKSAIIAFERARTVSAKIEDSSFVQAASSWIRWLRLIDPVQQKQEKKVLQEEMTHPSTVLEAFSFVLAFNFDFDLSILERHLLRAESLGGLSRVELDAKLHLLRRSGRFEEAARFLEENWDRLVTDKNKLGLTGLLIQTYVEAGEIGRAEGVWEERQEMLYPLDVPRFRLMIDHAKGEDPANQALANYQASGSIEDLWNLVNALERASKVSDLAPFSRTLFESEPTTDNALRYLRCLHQLKVPPEDALSFIDECDGQVQSTPDLLSAKAWALYRSGEIVQAKKINDQLLTSRHHLNDIGLDINLAMRLGEWERFPAIVEREWETRNNLPVSILLQLAKLASFRAHERAVELAKEVAHRGEKDPHILLQAHGVAISVGADDVGMPWVHEAAALSKDGEGPVSSVPYAKLVEMMKENADDWRRKNDLFKSGQIPLHLAAPMFNMPLSRFLLAIPRENRAEPDPRKRIPIPIRAGVRQAIETSGIQKISLDITTAFILADLSLLTKVIDVLELTFVSPRIMEYLLVERNKVEFHQPSRVRKAKPLLDMIRKKKLKITELQGPTWLVAEVGEEQASLLETARSTGGMYIHGGKLFKVGSYMDEEADIKEYATLLRTPVSVSFALHNEGLLDTEAFEAANKYLIAAGGEFTDNSTNADTVFCLDSVSAQLISEAGLLQTLVTSGHNVCLHPSTVEEWEALVATEMQTSALIETIDSVRQSLLKGVQSGKVQFLREAPQDEEEDRGFGFAELPVVDLLVDLRFVDATCIDDRMINSQPKALDKHSRQVPIITSFDLFDLLVDRQTITKETRRQCMHLMRRSCFYAIPVDFEETLQLLLESKTIHEGILRESAELRSIRENLCRIHSADVLKAPGDVSFLDNLWHTGLQLIREIWCNKDDASDLLVARANWVFTHIMPDIELAIRFDDDAVLRTVALTEARLFAFVILPVSEEWQKSYSQWVDEVVVAQFLPANIDIVDRVSEQVVQWCLARSKEVYDELAKTVDIADLTAPTKVDSQKDVVE